MVLCSSRKTVSLKFVCKKLAGPPVYYSSSNEPKEIVIDPEHDTGMFLIAIGFFYDPTS